jgi:hypothetical protein
MTFPQADSRREASRLERSLTAASRPRLDHNRSQRHLDGRVSLSGTSPDLSGPDPPENESHEHSSDNHPENRSHDHSIAEIDGSPHMLWLGHVGMRACRNHVPPPFSSPSRAGSGCPASARIARHSAGISIRRAKCRQNVIQEGSGTKSTWPGSPWAFLDMY